MKTSKLILNAVLIALLSIGTLSAQDSERTILRMSEITVKQGHYPQFTEGVKKWKECYGENNGERGWNMWERVQGEGSVFVMTGIMQNWAEMDKKDPANKECYAVVMNFIMPHVEKVNFNLAGTMPDISRTFPEDAELVWVWSVKVNNSTVFKENLESMSKAIVAREGKPRGVWYSFMGGAHDAPDYMVSVPFKGYADLDESRDNVWKIYEETAGKEKSDAMKASQREVIDVDWSYMYRLNKELSN
ncbi:MAG: hypothetical protein LC670_06800 [Flavobacteriales bacterium]|nr:hypothetical protein [Flavobacteriales bacterium]